MKNKQKQAHVARKMIGKKKRPRNQLWTKIKFLARSSKGGFVYYKHAFLNMFKCKRGACKRIISFPQYPEK